MPSKPFPERRRSCKTFGRNETVVLLPSASGRIVGFIVDLGHRNIPFNKTTARGFGSKDNVLDILLDGSFLPLETDEFWDAEDMEFDTTGFDMGNRLRRSLEIRRLVGNRLSELEYFLKHINMTEN